MCDACFTCGRVSCSDFMYYDNDKKEYKRIYLCKDHANDLLTKDDYQLSVVRQYDNYTMLLPKHIQNTFVAYHWFAKYMMLTTRDCEYTFNKNKDDEIRSIVCKFKLPYEDEEKTDTYIIQNIHTIHINFEYPKNTNPCDED